MTAAIGASITRPELECLEAVVRNGLQSFMAVGLALVEIRESRGYLLRGHQTFETYCQETFGFTARHGRRLMVAAKASRRVADTTGEAPANYNVARLLAPVAGDGQALRRVKARLEARGLSIANARGGDITIALPAPKTGAKKRAQIYVPADSVSIEPATDVCPGCHTRPLRYFYRELEGGWICSHCNTAVRLIVHARTGRKRDDE